MAAPGISVREIDSTGGVVEAQPSGRSAGVIGTANQGVAFVPVTFANNSQFSREFGNADADTFAPLALNEWLRNASAGTYVRVLGAGDGNKRTTSGNNTGRVTNAGFVVGSKQIQEGNGQLGNNPYAVAGGISGRTYFLGCYMSESAGSWVFSESGIQTSTAAAPIVRGVLMAASGVQLTLSSSAPGTTSDTYGTTAVGASPAKGWFTGSVDLRSGKQDFVLLLNGHADSAEYPSILTASFNPKDQGYFANTFNRDPLALERAGYVLYSHYDIFDAYAVVTGSGVAAQANIRRVSTTAAIEEVAFCLTGSRAYNDGTSVFPNYENFEDRFTHPSTPFFISQGNSPKDLFKIHARSDGAYANDLYKVSIKNIKAPTTEGAYGRFTVEIRDWNDTDDSPVVLESYLDCDLDPDSDNFVGKKIGDLNTYYDFDRAAGSQKIVEEGLYGKVSQRVRIELSDEVIDKLVPVSSLPVGFRGHYHLVTAGTGFLSTGSLHSSAHLSVPTTGARQPPIPFRRSITVGGASGATTAVGESKYYWGVQFDTANSVSRPNDGVSTTTAATRDASLAQQAKYFPRFHTTYQNPWVGDNAGAADVSGSVLDADRFNNNRFTLERVQVQTGSDGLIDGARWDEAVYQRDGAIDNSIGGRFIAAPTDFSNASVRSYLKLTTFMQGGFDGANIFDSSKLRMTDAATRREMDNSNQGGLSGPTVAAYRKAVDIMGEKAFADVHLLAIPGQRHPVVTDYALSAMQTRFDALYIMDVEHKDGQNNFITASLGASSYPAVNVSYTTTRFTNRGLNNSFGAAYFPDAVMGLPADPARRVRVPASVPVLGAFAQNDSLGYAWTAPAGYNRAVLNVEELGTKFLVENVDTVYDAGINPLVSAPGVGPVVNGQRTLLAEGSSLDRINVRRLLIEVRRRVRAVANTILFEPNREATIARFNAAVSPIMKQVQEQRGVDRYRVQIDTTTTTQADIENNTIRGKIFLQPTKSAEFISIDFEARNAASF